MLLILETSQDSYKAIFSRMWDETHKIAVVLRK